MCVGCFFITRFDVVSYIKYFFNFDYRIRKKQFYGNDHQSFIDTVIHLPAGDFNELMPIPVLGGKTIIVVSSILFR